MQIHKEK